MQFILLGILFALIGLIVALFIGNLIILILLRDLPWLRIFRAQHDVETVRNVVYVPGSKNHKHRLDLYRPRGKKRYPVVHFIHGGYWVSGDKEYYQAFTGLYANIGVALARRGVGAVVQSYRLAPAVSFEELLHDVLAAVSWTTKNAAEYGGDGSRVVLMGHSAGGHLAALLGGDPALLRRAGIDEGAVRGFIALSGIFDLEDMSKAHDVSFNEQVTYAVFGKEEGVLRRWSPISHFKIGTPPGLILVGGNDFPYLIPQAGKAHHRLEELGIKAAHGVVPGYSHMDMVLKFGRNGDQVVDRVVDFVDRATA